MTPPELESIDHVIRGSLNTALLNLQLVAPALGNDRDALALLEKARGELRRLAEVLIPAALDIVALEVRQLQRVPLRLLVQRALTRARLTGVTLHDGSWPSVIADPELLEIAVAHLARNAVAATAAGATSPEISTEARGDTVDVLVRDCGAGVAVPQGRGGHPVRAGHLGGLVAVSRIARLHGGTVSVEPRPGGGSIARLSLPANPRSGAVSANGAPVEEVAERQGTERA